MTGYNRIVLTIVGLVAGVSATVGVKEARKAWSVHEAFTTTETELRKKLPMKLNDSTTLVDVRVSMLTFTYIYNVSSDVTFGDSGDLQSQVCGTYLAKLIQGGGTIAYEYQITQGTIIHRVEITSCS